MIKRKIVVSLIQPTGRLHLGNYLGAIRQWIELQNDLNNDCRFGIADLHALTSYQGFGGRMLDVYEMTISLKALGIKQENLFLQSALKYTTDLAWLLSTYVNHNEMTRMTQFKDKGGGNMGLFTYPILQAADILIHNADIVPVGEDQKQHLELSRTIAERFNNRNGVHFTIPEPLIVENTKVYSVRDPEKKMSKSLGEEHCIFLDDSMEVIDAKIAKMPTDSGELKGTTEMTPGVSNIYGLLKAFAPAEVYQDMYDQYVSGGVEYSKLKTVLKEYVKKFCADFQVAKKAIEEESSLEVEMDIVYYNTIYNIQSKADAGVKALINVGLHKTKPFF